MRDEMVELRRELGIRDKRIRALEKALLRCGIACADYYLNGEGNNWKKHWERIRVEEAAARLKSPAYWLEVDKDLD